MSSGLFGVGVAGTELSSVEREILATHPPYGAILFRRNLESVEQVRALGGELKGLGARFLFLDQEGGPVDRLRELLAPAPSLQRAARAGAAGRHGELSGEALAGLGFDVNLAPVVDRGLPGAGSLVLGERCASDDADRIVEAGRAFLEGLHRAGVGGCLKHFPGLGRARLDTHVALPVVEKSPREEALDLAPFEALMETAGAVMISHAAGPGGLPASLSAAVASGLLRERLGFTGAAFSDDLEMGALAAFGGLPERCAAAAEAGCDLLFVCRQIESYPACVEAVGRAVSPARRLESQLRLESYAGHLGRIARAARRAGPRSLEAVVAGIRSFGESLA